MNFGEAVKRLLKGEKIRNEAWGEGVFISVEKGNRMVKTDSQSVVRSWIPTQVDIFSDKWKKVSPQTTLDEIEEE